MADHAGTVEALKQERDELRICLERLVDRVGTGVLTNAWPNLYKRIQAVLKKTEES